MLRLSPSARPRAFVHSFVSKNFLQKWSCRRPVSYTHLDVYKRQRIAQPNKPINKMRGLLRIHRRLPLLIAVPTTAGTGSEVTLAAVITDDETHYKYPINDFVLIPRSAVHDPEFTCGLPASITGQTGMDALTRCV